MALMALAQRPDVFKVRIIVARIEDIHDVYSCCYGTYNY